MKEEKINFEYFYFDIESYYFFRRFEVAVDKNIRQQAYCLYVLSCISPLPCYGPKSNLHHLQKISSGKHNRCANSKIECGRDVQRKNR